VYFTVLFAIAPARDIDATVPNVGMSKTPFVEYRVAVFVFGVPPWFEVALPWTVAMSILVNEVPLDIHVVGCEPDRVSIAEAVPWRPVLDVSRPVFVCTVGESLSNVA
jgi:hypothetical protein